jgi:hypoxanthine phosphoribosyltransferase
MPVFALASVKPPLTSIFSVICLNLAHRYRCSALGFRAQRIVMNNGEITTDGRWNVLVVDDLFDSGASMDAACAVLRKYPKVGKIYVAALTWK